MRSYLTNRGFTLIELMVALVIFSVLMLGTLELTYYSMRSNQKANWLTTAVSLAMDKLEELKATPYPLITSSTTDERINAVGEADPNSRFVRSWVVTVDTTTGFKDIVVTVRDPQTVWNSGSISVRTIVAP